MQRSILVSVITLVLFSLSGSHLSKLLLSKAGIEKSALIKTYQKSCSSSLLMCRGRICWLLPLLWKEASLWKLLEGVCVGGGVLVPLIASWWSLSCALAPVMPPASLLWSLKQPLCRAWPIPNPVAQMPSLNRSLVWSCLLSACLGSQAERPSWLILS